MDTYTVRVSGITHLRVAAGQTRRTIEFHDLLDGPALRATGRQPLGNSGRAGGFLHGCVCFTDAEK